MTDSMHTDDDTAERVREAVALERVRERRFADFGPKVAGALHVDGRRGRIGSFRGRCHTVPFDGDEPTGPPEPVRDGFEWSG
jgi:hypothetical protein